jgi:hypothetical protein
LSVLQFAIVKNKLSFEHINTVGFICLKYKTFTVFK